MKKTFPLRLPGTEPARTVEAVKHEIRKYLKRERRKKLPEGVDYWAFACRVGRGEATPEGTHVEALIAAIDQAASEGCGTVYVEILAQPGVRQGAEKAAGRPSGDPSEAPSAPAKFGLRSKAIEAPLGDLHNRA